MSVRLIRAVERVEKGAAKRRSESHAVGLISSSDNQRLEREPDAGQTVALDLYVSELVGWHLNVRSVERIAAAPEDLGVIYDSAGTEVLGKVVSIDPVFLSIEWAAGKPVSKFRSWTVPMPIDPDRAPPERKPHRSAR